MLVQSQRYGVVRGVDGFSFLCDIAVAFFNMVEVGVASNFKRVVEKFIDNGFFHGGAWVISSAVIHIPFAFLNLFLFFT